MKKKKEIAAMSNMNFLREKAKKGLQRIVLPEGEDARIVEAASDKQATDIVLLDTSGVCSFADYFVIMTGESGRQIEAIRQAIDEALKGEAITRHYEGSASSG